jgi:3-hydroxybutyrate dehydrogenase
MKTILITGSTSGIGLGIAYEFAKTKQYNIVFNGLEPNGQEIADGIAKEFGIETMYSNANMLNPEELRKMVADGISKFGKIDVLINNAGIQHVSPIEDFPDEKWAAIIGINLTSAFYLTKAVWKGMKERQFGRIINIASVHGLVASTQKAAYVAAKHGIIGLTKVTALENARTGITCNAICPGWVLTPLVQKQVDARAEREGISNEAAKIALVSEKQPSGQFVTPEQLAALAVFLCGPDASEVRGAAWNMDGGWAAQ